MPDCGQCGKRFPNHSELVAHRVKDHSLRYDISAGQISRIRDLQRITGDMELGVPGEHDVAKLTQAQGDRVIARLENKIIADDRQRAEPL